LKLEVSALACLDQGNELAGALAVNKPVAFIGVRHYAAGDGFLSHRDQRYLLPASSVPNATHTCDGHTDKRLSSEAKDLSNER
jgi:hypothetical protein